MAPNLFKILSGVAGQAAPIPEISFSASSYNPPANSSITISWHVTNASSVSIDNGIGAVAATGSTSSGGGNGTFRTFTLTAIGLDMISYTSTFSVQWVCTGILWGGVCYS